MFQARSILNVETFEMLFCSASGNEPTYSIDTFAFLATRIFGIVGMMLEDLVAVLLFLQDYIGPRMSRTRVSG